MTRATAKKALHEFLERVERVNRDPRFLGRVNRVVLFGSMLREEVTRLSDVDLAVEVLPKIDKRKMLQRSPRPPEQGSLHATPPSRPQPWSGAPRRRRPLLAILMAMLPGSCTVPDAARHD